MGITVGPGIRLGPGISMGLLPATSYFQLLLVGGGGVGSGNGGNYTPGGGGAGGFLWTSFLGASVAGKTFTVTVGAGGTGYATISPPRTGNVGSPTSFIGTGISHTVGGGGGGQYGAGGNQGTIDGNAGYTGYAGNSGGGAGAGGNATSMNGGTGALVSELVGITGVGNTGRFGGGGPGWNGSFGTGVDGAGAAAAGAANSGAGGSTVTFNEALQGYDGGSGIVVVRYASSYAAPSATTGSPTEVISNGYRHYIFNSSGTITF